MESELISAGVAVLESGEAQSALLFFERAVELAREPRAPNPKLAEALGLVAQASGTIGRLAEAVSATEEAVAILIAASDPGGAARLLGAAMPWYSRGDSADLDAVERRVRDLAAQAGRARDAAEGDDGSEPALPPRESSPGGRGGAFVAAEPWAWSHASLGVLPPALVIQRTDHGQATTEALLAYVRARAAAKRKSVAVLEKVTPRLNPSSSPGRNMIQRGLSAALIGRSAAAAAAAAQRPSGPRTNESLQAIIALMGEQLGQRVEQEKELAHELEASTMMAVEAMLAKEAKENRVEKDRYVRLERESSVKDELKAKAKRAWSAKLMAIDALSETRRAATLRHRATFGGVLVGGSDANSKSASATSGGPIGSTDAAAQRQRAKEETRSFAEIQRLDGKIDALDVAERAATGRYDVAKSEAARCAAQRKQQLQCLAAVVQANEVARIQTTTKLLHAMIARERAVALRKLDDLARLEEMVTEVDADSDMRLCVHNGLVALQLQQRPDESGDGGGLKAQATRRGDVFGRPRSKSKSSSQVEEEQRRGQVRTSTSRREMDEQLNLTNVARDEPFVAAWVRSLFQPRPGAAAASAGAAKMNTKTAEAAASRSEAETEAEAIAVAAAGGGGFSDGEEEEEESGDDDDAATTFGSVADGEGQPPALPARTEADAERDADARFAALCKHPFWRASILRQLNLQRSDSQTVRNEGCYGRMVGVMGAFLDACALQSDAKSASVLMIMSDTFFMVTAAEKEEAAEAEAEAEAEAKKEGADQLSVALDDAAKARRKYLQAGILTHRIWHDMGFWEEAFLLSVREAVQGTCAHLKQSPRDKADGAAAAAVREMSAEAAYLYKQIIFGQLGSWLLNLVNFRVSLPTIKRFMTRMSIANGLGIEERLALLAKLDALTKEEGRDA